MLNNVHQVLAPNSRQCSQVWHKKTIPVLNVTMDCQSDCICSLLKLLAYISFPFCDTAINE